MSPAVEVVLVTAAALSAFLAVALVVKGALAGGARTAGRAARMRVRGNLAPMHGAEGVERVVLTFAVGTEGAAQAARPHAGPIVARASDERIAGLLRHAGMEGALGVAGLRAARVRLAGFGAGAGFLLGVLLSWELGVLLALAGAALGYSAPVWALRRMEQRRALELERGLPEMLEVVALGLRSLCISAKQRVARTANARRGAPRSFALLSFRPVGANGGADREVAALRVDFGS